MRIIKNALAETEILCPDCNSTLAYTQKDIKHEDTEVFGKWILSDYIICPVCKENIILRNILL